MLNPANDIISASVEDYLKAIYTQTRSGQPTSTLALAQTLQIRSASVTSMLQKLAQAHPDWVIYRKHYGISLTPAGERIALRIIRRHRLIEQFLYEILGYPLEKIHEEADELEHAVSPYFIERLAHLLQHPAFDPHGDPIPDNNLILNDPRSLISLSELQDGESGIVRHITDQNAELLIFLYSAGICLGTELAVNKTNPIDGTRYVTLSETLETQVLGRSISDHIQVEKIQD